MTTIDESLINLDSFLERVPPHNRDAEQTLLGVLLNVCSEKSEVLSLLAPSDFYYDPHRFIFAAMKSLNAVSEPIDLMTVSEELDGSGKLTLAGGRGYVSELAGSVLFYENAVAYAKIIKAKAVERELISVSAAIAESAFSALTTDEKLGAAYQAVSNLVQRQVTDELLSLYDVANDGQEAFLETITGKRPNTSLKTGFKDLDACIGGLSKGSLTTIGARPGMGKSALMLNMAKLISEKDKHVLIFSLEMGATELRNRMLAPMANISANALKHCTVPSYQLPQVQAALNDMSFLKLTISTPFNLTPEKMDGICAKLQARHSEKLGLVIVDYLQLMSCGKSGSGNRVEEVSKITRGLKVLAMKYDCPVIAISQLSRAVESRPDKRPMLSDLRESGSVEQDSDNVIFIYRDEYYNKDSAAINEAELIVAKQRNGSTGTVKLLWNGDKTQFTDKSF